MPIKHSSSIAICEDNSRTTLFIEAPATSFRGHTIGGLIAEIIVRRIDSNTITVTLRDASGGKEQSMTLEVS